MIISVSKLYLWVIIKTRWIILIDDFEDVHLCPWEMFTSCLILWFALEDLWWLFGLSFVLVTINMIWLPSYCFIGVYVYWKLSILGLQLTCVKCESLKKAKPGNLRMHVSWKNACFTSKVWFPVWPTSMHTHNHSPLEGSYRCEDHEVTGRIIILSHKDVRKAFKDILGHIMSSRSVCDLWDSVYKILKPN